jgi:hypothetical protein
MLEFVREMASERQLRLLAAACHRRIFHLLEDQPICRKTLEFAERFADGLATTTELRGHAWGKPANAFSAVLYKALDAAENSLDFASGTVREAVLRRDATLYARYEQAFDAAFATYSLKEARHIATAQMPSEWIGRGNAARDEEQAAQCMLMREIFGPLPFRSIQIDRSRLALEVVRLAQRIYDYRAFNLLPALAEAIAGGAGDNLEVLSHIQHASEHVKGCWALDLLLEKH